MINLIQHIANKKVEVVVPVIQGATIFEHRKIKLDPDLHGWYVLRIGNEVEIVREASLREPKVKLQGRTTGSKDRFFYIEKNK